MKTKILLKILVLTSFLTAFVGCGGSPVKQVAVASPIKCEMFEETKPIMFKKVVIKLRRGESIGRMKAGLLCVDQGPLTWKGGRVTLSGDELT